MLGPLGEPRPSVCVRLTLSLCVCVCVDTPVPNDLEGEDLWALITALVPSLAQQVQACVEETLQVRGEV